MSKPPQDSEAGLQVDYKATITRQAVTITDQAAIISSQQEANAKLNESLLINDRKTMILEKQNESQKFIIAKLDAELRQKDEKIEQLHAGSEEKNQLILQLTQQNQTLLQSRGGASRSDGDNAVILDQIRKLFEEFHAGMKRKCADDESV